MVCTSIVCDALTKRCSWSRLAFAIGSHGIVYHFVARGSCPGPDTAASHRGLVWSNEHLRNHRGVFLGDSWIAPTDFVDAWGPMLEAVSLIGPTGLERISALANLTKVSFETIFINFNSKRKKYKPTARINEHASQCRARSSLRLSMTSSAPADGRVFRI